MNFKSHLAVFSLITALYMVSMLVVVVVIDPIQRMYLPHITPFATLIFLPHGVRVVTAWLYGGWSVPYLFFAAIIADLLIRGTTNPATILITSVVCFASFELFKLSGLDMYAMKGFKNTNLWRSLMLVAFVSSVFNSILHNIVLQSAILPENTLQTLLSYVVGDVLGTLIVFFIALLFFKATGLTKVKATN